MEVTVAPRVMVVTVRAVPRAIVTPAVVVVLVSVVLVVRAGRGRWQGCRGRGPGPLMVVMVGMVSARWSVMVVSGVTVVRAGCTAMVATGGVVVPPQRRVSGRPQ